VSFKSRMARLGAGVLIIFSLGAMPLRLPFGVLGPQMAAATCNGFTIYERVNKGGWHNAPGCGDISNLKNINGGITFVCDGNGPFSLGTWNDCISSFSANVTGTTQMCFWSNENYSGDGLKLNPNSNGWWNMPAFLDNKSSSIEWANSDCFPGGNQG
jgi:hypothetical protein